MRRYDQLRRLIIFPAARQRRVSTASLKQCNYRSSVTPFSVLSAVIILSRCFQSSQGRWIVSYTSYIDESKTRLKLEHLWEVKFRIYKTTLINDSDSTVTDPLS